MHRKRSLRTTGAASALIVLYFCMIQPRNARADYSSSYGAVCVPMDTAIQGNLYQVNAGSVLTIANTYSDIDLYCPVKKNSSAANPDTLGLSTYNSYGVQSTNGNVTATLWRKRRDTGTILSIGSVQLQGQPLVPLSEYNEENFTSTLDFETYYYYIRVTIHPDDSPSNYIMTFRGIRMY